MTWYRFKNAVGEIVQIEVKDEKTARFLEKMFDAKRVQPPPSKPPSTKRPSLAVVSMILLAVVLALVGGGIWLQQSAQKAASPSSNSPSSSSQPSSGSSSDEAAVENMLREHYNAIGTRDYNKVYADFTPTFQQQHSKQDWINDIKSLRINHININSVKVNNVSGDKATAAVDYTSALDYTLPNGSSAVRQLDTLKNIVKENGQWKMDDQISHQVIG